MNTVIETADTLQNKNMDISGLKETIVEMGQLSDQLQILSAASDVTSIEQFNKSISSMSNVNASKHPKVSEFNRKLNIDEGDSEDEDQEEEEQIFSQAMVSLNCPITKQRFKEPVTSECGHTFEESAILQMLRQGQGAHCQCPFVGCTRLITKDALQPDIMMKRRLQRSGITQTQVDVEI